MGDRTESRLILLIGLPGSGKSTLAASLVSWNPRRSLVSTDQIRAQLFGDEAVQGSWLRVWAEVQRQFRQSLEAIAHGEIAEVIYDATNVVRRQRRQVIRLAREVGFTEITGLWLDVPLDCCLQRNRQRQRQVPEPVIHRMHRCLLGAPPHLTEGLNGLIRYHDFGDRHS